MRRSLARLVNVSAGNLLTYVRLLTKFSTTSFGLATFFDLANSMRHIVQVQFNRNKLSDQVNTIRTSELWGTPRAVPEVLCVVASRYNPRCYRHAYL